MKITETDYTEEITAAVVDTEDGKELDFKMGFGGEWCEI
jgi:hypothetical protein